jgi:hypothetical protein
MVTYQNAIDAFAKSGQINQSDFETTTEIDQTAKFFGNSILRGGQSPRVDKESIMIK